jgi:diguanylate cyclase (GGDEF)-like protein
MTNLDLFRQTGIRETQAEPVSDFPDEVEQQVTRVRRIGKRLFDVSNCIVTFKEGATAHSSDEWSIEAIESAFCASLPIAQCPTIIADASKAPSLAGHRSVAGAPYIRFYAAHPIVNEESVVVGCVSLIDYAPRAFSDEDKQLLADLSALIARELQMNAMNASQHDLVKKNRNLRRESLIDPVVGTWNRAAITRLFGVEADRCRKEEKPLSLVFAELDFFREINGTHGQPAGDNVLLKAASRLRSCIRPSDALGRYEGEKFMIVLPGASHATVMVVAERMRQAIMTQPEQIGETTLNLTISSGTVSTDLFPSSAIDELITHADMALRSAKNAGHNRIAQAMPANPASV